MKKILAVALTLMLIPFSAFGMQMLEDSTLDDVTGQAGVSIATDVIMDVHFDTVAWGDADGIDTDATQSTGWVGITDLDIQDLRIKIRDDYAAAGNFGAIQLFTIDVATSDNGTAGDASDDYTYVHMILGTQQVTFDYMDGQVELGADTGLGEVMGDFYIDDFVLLMNPDSYVDISAHGGAGVTIDFGVSIDSIDMAAMSWGDGDGIGGAVIAGLTTNLDADVDDFTNPGYIGLFTANIDDLAVSGQLLIDVATIDLAAIDPGVNGWDPTIDDPDAYLLGVYRNMLLTGYDGGTTAVLMQFNGLSVTMASFTADVVLAADNALTTGASTLGSVYAGGMNVTMDGWVGIFAH